MTDDEELQNKMWQQSRIIEYMNEMPVMQFMLPEIEADDVIAHITQLSIYDGWQKLLYQTTKILCKFVMKKQFFGALPKMSF